MLLAVAESGGEGCEIDAIGSEVQGLDAGDGEPEQGSMPPVKIQG